MNPDCSLTLYDRIPYPSQARPQTHPDRLAVLGTLFGLAPAPVNACRVLEVGCGDGSNLVPLAYALPDSQFVGVDLAAKPIAAARSMSAELGLTNVRFEHADLADIEADPNPFDYILAHGVFSWVPAATQAALLDLCRSHLNKHGIAFISYDAYPGAHARDGIREALRFHVQSLADPAAQVDQARALIRLLANGADAGNPDCAAFRRELEEALCRDGGHLLHDDLAECHTAFYFLEFVRQATAHGLQYLAEADFFEMSTASFDPEIQAILGCLGRDRLRREQYLDFLKWRRFRQTLLCRADGPARSEADPALVSRFLAATAAQPATVPVDLRPGTLVRFETPRGGRIDTDLPLGKAALAVLGARAPEPLAVPALFDSALGQLRQAALEEAIGSATPRHLHEYLLACYAAGVVEFHTVDPPHATEVPARPRASAVARWQSRRGATVTTLRHQSVRLGAPAELRLLEKLDGTRDLAALAREGGAENPVTGTAGEADAQLDDRAMPRRSARDLEVVLARFARLGLLLP
jgi:SAM-dependent methyltransferase